MKDHIESYYQQVFDSVVRLARLTDEHETNALTREILDDLWEKRELLEAESRKGVFIYKLVLVHVFAHLRANGEEKKIGVLRRILLIHPDNYKLPEPGVTPREEFGP